MREMKDSGIEWIREMPDGWTLRKGYSLYDITTGKLDVNAENPEGIYPFFTCSMHPKRIDYYAFDCEALLVAGNGIVGFTQYYSGKFNAYQRTYVLSNFRDIIPGFLRYYVSNNLSTEVAPKAIGSVIQFIKLSDLKGFNVTVPSLSEQKAITEYLDEKTSKIDALIANEEKQIEKLKEYKQSLITKVVTKGLDPDAPMKDSGVEWIGMIPQNWDIYRIASLYSERNERGVENLPILTVSINTGITDYEVSDEERTRIVNRSEDRTKYKRVYVGDLAYNMMRAWQGAFGAVRVNGMVSPAYTVAKPNGIIKIDSRYLEALLRTPSAIEEMHRYSRGIMDFRLRLYWPEFKAIKVCVPSFEEQKRIADRIDLFSKQVNILIEIKQKKIDRLIQYKKALIFEYVTGKKEVDI